MVAAGSIMLLVAFVGLILNAKDKLVGNRTFLKIMFWTFAICHSLLIPPVGLWQETVVNHGLYMTYINCRQFASKAVTAPEIMTTIIGFTVVYIVAAIAALYLAVEHIKRSDGSPSRCS